MKHSSKLAAGVSLIVSGILLSGCGKSGSSSAADATPAKPTAAVESGSDLVGTWFVTDDRAPMMGLEFGKDNKAVVTVNLMEQHTCDYAVMDNGRMRLVMPDGQTVVFKCNVDSKAMTLNPETAGTFPELHLKKLEGQTIADAQHAKQAEVAARRKAALDAIRAKVNQPNLVLESADASTHLSRYALEIKGGPDQWQGTITSDSNPPLVRQAVVSLQSSDPARLVVQVGAVQGPPGEADRQPMNITLTATGEGEKLDLQDNGLALRSDAEASKAITDSYQKIVQERQQAIDQFAAGFGAYCRLVGDFRNPNSAPTSPATHADFGLLRVEGKPAFMVANLARKTNPARTDFNGVAQIQFDKGKPVLALQSYGGVFTADDSGKPQLQGTMQQLNGTLAISDVMTKDQLAAKRKQVDDFLKTTLGQGVHLVGVIDINKNPKFPVPVAMDLKTDANLNVTGTIDVLHLGEGQFAIPGKITPTLFGAVMEFNGTQRTKPGMSNLMGGYRKGTLDITFDKDAPTFSGVISGGYQSGPGVMTVASADTLKAQHDKIAKLLTDGAEFVVTDPHATHNQPAHLILKLDADGKTITGTSTPGSHNEFFGGGGALHGTLDDNDGFPFVDLIEDPGIGLGKRKVLGGELKFWVLFDDAGQPMLSGSWIYSARNPKTAEPAKAFLATEK